MFTSSLLVLRGSQHCACNATFRPPGCATGGGEWRNLSYVCMNYWSPSAAAASDPACTTVNSTLGCIANLTSKIQGDDSAHVMDVFEAFLAQLQRPEISVPAPGTLLAHGPTPSLAAAAGSEAVAQPFFAALWLHAIHLPHPALPEFYHNYTDAFGDPAGDYLGLVTQTDVQVGRLRRLLKSRGLYNNTLLWYTSDNGPSVLDPTPGDSYARDRSSYQALAATNGLRQCKGECTRPSAHSCSHLLSLSIRSPPVLPTLGAPRSWLLAPPSSSP